MYLKRLKIYVFISQIYIICYITRSFIRLLYILSYKIVLVSIFISIVVYANQIRMYDRYTILIKLTLKITQCFP